MKKHINLLAPSDTNNICVCLCGYTYPTGRLIHGETESLHVNHLDYEAQLQDKNWALTTPNCEACLERLPLALLAMTDLE